MRYRPFPYFTLLTLAVVVTFQTSVPAHDPKPAGTQGRSYAAVAAPDRIALTVTDAPATSVSVTWRTAVGIKDPQVEIAEAKADPRFVKDARRVSAGSIVSTTLTSENGVALFHATTIRNLKPNTLYGYRVKGGVWSEWFHFKTASASPEPFSFLYFGDAQNDILSLWSRVVRGAHLDAPKARFMVHAGDLVNLRAGNHDDEWGEWFDAGRWLFAMTPSLPATGNHEYTKKLIGDDYEGLSPHWRPQFALPDNGPAVEDLRGTVYHLDYQGVRFIVLNSNHALESGSAAAQAHWMEPLLKNNPNRWTIAVYHHPMYSVRAGRDNDALRTHWKPLFDKYGVDLALQGHDHAYGRGFGGRNTTEGAFVRDTAGTVYVVSVSGPKMYDSGVAPWAKRLGENTQLYQIIHVAGDTLRY